RIPGLFPTPTSSSPREKQDPRSSLDHLRSRSADVLKGPVSCTHPDPTKLASHGPTQYHGGFFHGLWSVLRSPGTQKLDGGAVHRWSRGNQAGIRLLLQVGDGVRNGGKRAPCVEDSPTTIQASPGVCSKTRHGSGV